MPIFIPKKTAEVLQLIENAGFEAYIVGGFVRDALLGKNSHDCDIATNAKPNEIEAIFKENTTSTIGKKHGTIGVLHQATWFEITTYRSDQDYHDFRHPQEVHFVSRLSEDLVRRDFTINALALSPKAQIVDIVDGIKDLEAKLIRCVGDPQKRFKEDALRIIRALRFAAQLNFTIEASTAYALHQNAALIQMISIERVIIEFQKILQAKSCAQVLYTYRDVIQVFMPEIVRLNKETILKLDRCENVLQKYCLLYSQSPLEDMGLSLKQLRFSNAMSKDLLQLHAFIKEEKAMSEYDLKCFLRDYDPEIIKNGLKVQALLNTNFDALLQIQQLERLIDSKAVVSIRQLDISGQDLYDLGLKEKAISDMLEILLDKVMHDQLSNKKMDILAFVKRSLS